MLDIEKMEKNERLLFDEVNTKIRNFVYDIQNNIWDNFNNTNVSGNYSNMNSYFARMGQLLNSRFNEFNSEPGKHAKEEYERIKKRFEEYSKKESQKSSEEEKAIVNEMKVFCSDFTDSYGIKYEYKGDGTSEKKGDIILESNPRIKKISYKGITYESNGKITFSLPNYLDSIISYNSEEKTVEFRNVDMFQQPELTFKIEIKEDELFVDTVINLLKEWLEDHKFYKPDSEGTNSKQQYDKISTIVSNLIKFKEMLKSEFVTYRLITENEELKRKNEQIEPLQSAVETKKSENEQLNSEIAKKDDQITEKDEKISGLETRVADLEENQRFLFSTLKEIANQVAAVTTKPLVFSSDLKKLQGYTEASMSATQLQGIEEPKKM